MACQRGCQPAKAMVMSQPRKVGKCDGGGHLLPTPQTYLHLHPPFLLLPPREGAGSSYPSQPQESLIVSHSLRSCLTSNLQPLPPNCLCPFGISTNSRSAPSYKEKVCPWTQLSLPPFQSQLLEGVCVPHCLAVYSLRHPVHCLGLPQLP